MTRRLLAAAALLATAAVRLGAQRTDLDRIRSIPDLVKRSREAIQLARSQFDAAMDLYGADDAEAGGEALELIAEAVETAVASLQSTGKHPRRHPRHFKHAEIRTRELLERLREARIEAHLLDQADFDDPIRRIEKANADLLLGIMSKRK